MIVADTSVWVEALRSAGGTEAEALSQLLDEDRIAIAAPIRLELLLGASNEQAPRLRRLLSALPCWFPERDDWALAEGWVEPALRAGHRFGFADFLIAAIAAARDARLWSLDRDFERMAALGLIELYSPDSAP